MRLHDNHRLLPSHFTDQRERSAETDRDNLVDLVYGLVKLASTAAAITQYEIFSKSDVYLNTNETLNVRETIKDQIYWLEILFLSIFTTLVLSQYLQKQYSHQHKPLSYIAYTAAFGFILSFLLFDFCQYVKFTYFQLDCLLFISAFIQGLYFELRYPGTYDGQHASSHRLPEQNYLIGKIELNKREAFFYLLFGIKEFINPHFLNKLLAFMFIFFPPVSIVVDYQYEGCKLCFFPFPESENNELRSDTNIRLSNRNLSV